MPESSFSANATLVQLIWDDDFQREVPEGFGLRYRNWFGQSENSALVTGVFGQVFGAIDYPYYESPTGFRRPQAGYAQFTCWVPADPADDAFFIAVDGANPDTGNGNSPSELDIYHDGGGSWAADIFPSDMDPYVWAPDPETLYTIKGMWGRDVGDPVAVKVWKTSDPEPDTWNATGLKTAYFGSPNTWESALWVDSFADTGQDAYIDDLKLWRSTSHAWEYADYFTCDAFLLKTNFTADAVIASRRFTADAIIKATVTKSGTPAQPEHVGESYVSSWTPVSSIVINKPTGTTTGDIILIAFLTDAAASSITATVAGFTAFQTTSFADNSVFRVLRKTAGGSEPSSYTINISPATGVSAICVVSRGVDQVTQFDFDATSLEPQPIIGPTPFVDDIESNVISYGIFAMNTFGPLPPEVDPPLTHVIDTPDFYQQLAAGYEVLRTTGPTGGYTATPPSEVPSNTVYGLVLLGNDNRGFTMDAELGQPRFTANAILKKTTTSSFSMAANIGQLTRHEHHLGDDPHLDYEHTDDVILGADIGSYPVSTTLQEYLEFLNREITKRESFVTANWVSDAILRVNRAASALSDAILRAAREASFTGDAFLSGGSVFGSFTADAWKFATQSFGALADAVLKREQSASANADAVLLRTTTGSFTEDSILHRVMTGSFLADAYLFTGSVSGSFTADAIKRVIASAAATLDAVIAGTAKSKARITQNAVEVMVSYTAPSPTTVTGAGVTQALVEVMVQNSAPVVRLSQDVIEVMAQETANTARVTQDVVEIMVSYTAPSPTTVTGAGVTQQLIEVMVQDSGPDVRVTQEAVEIMVRDT